MCRRGEISFQEVAAQCQLELFNNPLTAEALLEFLLPGQKKDNRKKQHNTTNDQTFAIWKAMRDGK